jgi:hypothetical protein
MSDPFAVSAEIETELRAIYAQYAALVAEGFDAERGLGGCLLWAGALDRESGRLARAASIAGAASLIATADPAEGKHALREGEADFLVTTLDEALRILKNEIRKRQPVAVCVLLTADAVRAEMLERGVLPDLLPAHSASEDDAFVAQGARRITPQPDCVLAVFRIPPALLPHSAGIDAPFRDALDADDEPGRRWLKLAASYLPTTMRRARRIAFSELV